MVWNEDCLSDNNDVDDYDGDDDSDNNNNNNEDKYVKGDHNNVNKNWDTPPDPLKK